LGNQIENFSVPSSWALKIMRGLWEESFLTWVEELHGFFLRSGLESNRFRACVVPRITRNRMEEHFEQSLRYLRHSLYSRCSSIK
jgi:hypothetical protein